MEKYYSGKARDMYLLNSEEVIIVATDRISVHTVLPYEIKYKGIVLNKLSEFFKILGDTTRTKILYALDKNEMCVCDIANVLGMSKSSISHQLGTLRRCGIVKCKKVGKEVFYMLDDEHVKEVFEVGIEHIEHKR